MSLPRLRLTAAGRLTAWYALLFAFAATSMALGSYGLVRRAFDDGPSKISAAETFERLGVAMPTPEQFDQVTKLLGTDPRVLVATASQNARRDVLDEFAKRSTASLIVTVLASTLGAWWLARRGLRPVRRLTSLAQGISASNLHDRIDLVGPDDELKALADTFDGMLARLEQAFDAQRLFAAHVSHELRTPLSTLRAEADLVADDPSATARERRLAATTRATVERSDVLIGSLLALSRAESGMTTHDVVDVADLAGDAVAELAGLADAATVALDLTLANASIVGDRVLVRAMIDNLVRNAILHNHPRGLAAVDVRTAGDNVVITVENSGRQMNARDVAALAKPFARGESGRTATPGSGIGTAVVQAVAAAHRGTFKLIARANGGLIATVELPVTAVPR